MAILPVLLFHLGVETFSGGFVGVDVFFVISGYLITTGLMWDLREGRFSLVKFYQRRILRIFPALLVLLIFVIVVSTFVYFPSELSSIGWQTLSSATFTSNFFFWTEAGYFTSAAENQPLLHTWSLAIEEQFYILFPILLYILFKFARKKLVEVLITIGLLSLGACVYLTYLDEATAFYLLPTRAWEMGAGALLSIMGTRVTGPKRATWLSFVGVALVLVPIFAFQSGTPVFPGWAAVFPVLGAVLLVGWAEGTVVGKVLSFPPVVYIGKISFSLYLWHWPLIVFYKAHYGPTINGWDMLILGIASTIAAIISTEFVERPFRSRSARAMPYGRVITFGLTVSVLVAGLGGLQAQRPVSAVAAAPEVLDIAEVSNYRDTLAYEHQFRKGTCFIGEDDGGLDAFDVETCATVDTDRSNVLLVGDSHAAMFWGGLDRTFPNLNIMQVTSSGCRPLLDGPGAQRCVNIRDLAFGLITSGEIDTVIFAGRWSRHETNLVAPTLEFAKEHVANVILFGPTVEYDGVFPTLLAHSLLNESAFELAHARTSGIEDLDRAMRTIADDADITYFSVLDAICPDGICTEYATNGYPMQFDYGHLTLPGSHYVLDERSFFQDVATGQ